MNYGGRSISLISRARDTSLIQNSGVLSLSTAWKAFTPPNTALQWAVLVGFPSVDKDNTQYNVNSTWENLDGHGVHVQYRSDDYSKSIEGTSVRLTFWDPPPDMLFSGSRQWLVSKEKYVHNILNGNFLHQRQKLFEHWCQAFHRRHPLPEQRLKSLKLYILTNL